MHYAASDCSWEPLDVPGVIEVLDRVPGCWWLSGGYAIDEFLGFASRAHGDVDVTVAKDYHDYRLVMPRLTPHQRPCLSTPSASLTPSRRGGGASRQHLGM